MKRYETMSKEEVFEAMKPANCGECIVPRDFCNERPGRGCSTVKSEYLDEEIETKKKRRCDIYSLEELSDEHHEYCAKTDSCSRCEWHDDKYGIPCKYKFAYGEVEVIDGKEVKHERDN